MKLTRGAAHAVVLSVASAAAAGEAGLDAAEWSHCARVGLDAPPAKRLVELALTPEVFHLARADLADLRVVNESGAEVPCLVRAAAGKSRRQRLKVRLYNRTFLPGEQSSVTADLGAKAVKNRVRVETGGTNFRRRVLVEGSDDGESWEVVRRNAFLFRIPREATGAGYDRDVVELPDNDQRYLRLTVYNAPDDPERVEIRGVAAWRLVGEPPETSPVSVVASSVVEKQHDRATEIALDLGFRNLPLHELALGFGDADFCRRVKVFGRNRTERIVKRAVEDGPALEETVEEPWRTAASGAVFRYSSGGSVDESLVVDLNGAKYRYLLVRIANRDDAPLQFTGASVTRLVHYVSFPPRGGDFTLYFGNPGARRPGYDLAHYADRLRAEGVARAALAEVADNPSFGRKERELPWSERHKWLLWAALVVVLLALGLLVCRQAKSAGAAEDKEGGGEGEK